MKINIPKKLKYDLYIDGFQISRVEATYLIWRIIDKYESTESSKDGWKTINDKEIFKKIINSDKIRCDIRRWLEDNKYIELKKMNCKNGKIRNHVIPGIISQQYKSLQNENLVEYEIICRSIPENMIKYV